MNEKQRQQQHDARPKSDGDGDPGEISAEGQAALAKVSDVDSLIDDILSSATTGNYLNSIRQRGGQ